MDPNLVLLAGGVLSRMRRGAVCPDAIDPGLIREADHKPKSMIGVGTGGRPFLDYLLLNAAAAGYRDVVLVVGQSDVAYAGPLHDGNGRGSLERVACLVRGAAHS